MNHVPAFYTLLYLTQRMNTSRRTANYQLVSDTDVLIKLPAGVHGQVIPHVDAPLGVQARLENHIIEPGS